MVFTFEEVDVENPTLYTDAIAVTKYINDHGFTLFMMRVIWNFINDICL